MDHEARLEQIRGDLSREYSARSGTVQFLMALAAGILVVLWISLSSHAFPAWVALVGVVPGTILLRRMGRIHKRLRKLGLLSVFYDRALTRQNHTWMDDPQIGAEYDDPDHLYASDLDLFGRGSLFQLMCVARTGVGRDALALYMKEIATESEAKARTEAVEELSGRLDLREATVTAGQYSFSDCRTETFREWLRAPSWQISRWAAPTAFLLSLGVPLLAALGAFGVVSAQELFRFLVGWAVLAAGFSGMFQKPVSAVIGDIGMPSVELAILSDLIGILEQQKFDSPKLRSLSEALNRPDAPASLEVARLRRLVKVFERGKTFEPLTWILLWDAQFAMRIEHWRKQHGEAMQVWLEAIGEFESLNAISTYAFEHPGDTKAEFVSGPATFDAIGLGHPLLDDRKCVRNDVSLGTDVPLWIVSGSNMSGKSTLLRACGLTVVLASMGAPVRAHRFRVSNMALATALGIQDSLLDGKSKFFAEVARLKSMIDLAGQGRPLLFLVDEMLSGTNSQDRRTASEAVIHALLERGALGLTTTHDLALTRMAEEGGVAARNVHFADSADSGGLDFDYRLRPGVVQRSNALAIVEMLGIPLRGVRTLG